MHFLTCIRELTIFDIFENRFLPFKDKFVYVVLFLMERQGFDFFTVHDWNRFFIISAILLLA